MSEAQRSAHAALTDGLSWKLPENFQGCKPGEFLGIATGACESCAKYCFKRIISETCPQECADYFTKKKEIVPDYQVSEPDIHQIPTNWIIGIITAVVISSILIGTVILFMVKRKMQSHQDANNPVDLEAMTPLQPEPGQGGATPNAMEARSTNEEPKAFTDQENPTDSRNDYPQSLAVPQPGTTNSDGNWTGTIVIQDYLPTEEENNE